jgi:hypothetical protein
LIHERLFRCPYGHSAWTVAIIDEASGILVDDMQQTLAIGTDFKAAFGLSFGGWSIGAWKKGIARFTVAKSNERQL